jgi:hypothetical protein
MQNAFPTLGAAVLYLNGFHHGKHLDRLNYLSRHNPEWVMSIAESMWESRDENIAKDYPDLLAFSIKELYVKTFNEQVDAKQVH